MAGKQLVCIAAQPRIQQGVVESCGIGVAPAVKFSGRGKDDGLDDPRCSGPLNHPLDE